MNILCIDIGGTHIKGTILNASGEFLTDFVTLDSPHPATPEKILEVIQKLAHQLGAFDAVSAGFPGYIKNGVVATAPKLGNEFWNQIPLQKNIEEALGKPAKLVNDADFQGYAFAGNKGFDLVITLGTGFGSSLFHDGQLLPHLEMSLHPFTEAFTYNSYIGEDALLAIGEEKWNERMKHVLQVLKTVFNYDHLYISGGNASRIRFSLDKNISLVSNKDGIKGGIKLWQN